MLLGLINARGLQLECARVIHPMLLMPVFMHCIKTIIWKEMEKCRIMAVQMDNLRGWLGIRRMDKAPNA